MRFESEKPPCDHVETGPCAQRRRAVPWFPAPRVLLLVALGMLFLLALPVAAGAAEAPEAADPIFGTASPLKKFIGFITGIFAYMLVIVGTVVTLGGLILGSDMSGFARRAPVVVVAGAVLILADKMVLNLFGTSVGAEIPPDMVPLFFDLLVGIRP